MEKLYALSLFDNKINITEENKFLTRKLRKLKMPTKFLRIYNQIFRKFKMARATEKCYDKSIIKMLDKIIPSEYFGTTKNRKRFYFVVNKITTQTRHECIFKELLWKRYDIQSIKWIDKPSRNVSKGKKLLLKANLCILNHIVKPLIKHFYYVLHMMKDHEVRFIPRNEWAKYQDKIYNSLVKRKHLIEHNSAKARGDLNVYPKGDLSSLDYRPIMISKKIDKKIANKYKMISKKLISLATNYSKCGRGSLFLFWDNITSHITDETVLYGIKLDVEDAFGNVDIQTLCQLIADADLLPLEKQFLLDHVQNQFVCYKGKVFKWNHGLLQGDRLSSSLCELYMCFMESNNLQRFIGNDSVARLVDDYLFCTTEKSEIRLFETELRNLYPINESKVEYASGCPNFEFSFSKTDQRWFNFVLWDAERDSDSEQDSGMEQDSNMEQDSEIDYKDELTFSGHVINFKTRQVSKSYKCDSFRNKFKFWNKPLLENVRTKSLSELKDHIIRWSLRYLTTNHCFTRLSMNTSFNTEETDLMNWFKGMVYVASKCDLVVRAVTETANESSSTELPLLYKTIATTIVFHTKKIYAKLLKNKGIHFKENISYKLLRNIANRAFVLVLKSNTPFYKSVIEQMCCKKYMYLNLGNLSRDIAHAFTELPIEFSTKRVNRKSKI